MHEWREDLSWTWRFLRSTPSAATPAPCRHLPHSTASGSKGAACVGRLALRGQSLTGREAVVCCPRHRGLLYLGSLRCILTLEDPLRARDAAGAGRGPVSMPGCASLQILGISRNKVLRSACSRAAITAARSSPCRTDARRQILRADRALQGKRAWLNHLRNAGGSASNSRIGLVWGRLRRDVLRLRAIIPGHRKQSRARNR